MNTKKYEYTVSIKSVTSLIFRKQFKIISKSKNREMRIQLFRGVSIFLRRLGMLFQGDVPGRPHVKNFK